MKKVAEKFGGFEKFLYLCNVNEKGGSHAPEVAAGTII